MQLLVVQKYNGSVYRYKYRKVSSKDQVEIQLDKEDLVKCVGKS